MARRKSKAKLSDEGAAIIRALRRAVQVADSALKELSDGPQKRPRRKSKGRTKGRTKGR
jgi:DNA-binding transcriptional LysR family regulator